MRIDMMNVNENENLRISNNSDEIYVIRKSWWGVLSSSIFTAILPVIFVSIIYFLFNGLFSAKFLSFRDNLMNFQDKSYYYTIAIILSVIVLLKILSVIFDSIEVNVKTREIYCKTLFSEEMFTDITSVNFSKLPVPYFTLLTFHNKSGQKMEFSNCYNEKLAKNIIKAFSKK